MKDIKDQNGFQGNRTQECTFEITVRFTQNATWQGKICWLEKNKCQNFRSALEMLKLMDEALADTNPGTQIVSWEWV